MNARHSQTDALKNGTSLYSNEILSRQRAVPYKKPRLW